MAYEIPQELEYKEIIMFGLTFRQLVYLFLFAPQILFIFFKTSLNIYIKVFLSLLPSSLGIGFIFLHLDERLANWYAWFRFRKADTKEKIAKFIKVKEVNHDLIITKR